MVFCTYLDVRGLRLETWKPRKFVLNGSVLRSYVDDPSRGHQERGAYLVDADTFVTVIHNFLDEPRAKERHTYVFSLLTKNMNDGYMTTRLTVSARDEDSFLRWLKVIRECVVADELRNPRQRKSRNFYGTDSTAYLNICYQNSDAQEGQERSIPAAEVMNNFHDDAILPPRIFQEKPEVKFSFNNRISYRAHQRQERKLQKDMNGENSKKHVLNFYQSNRGKKLEGEYEIKEYLLKVEKKKKNNLVKPPFYPPGTHGLPQMYRPVLSITPLKRGMTAKSPIRKTSELSGPVYDRDGYRVGDTLVEKGDDGDEGEEKAPQCDLNDLLSESFDIVEDDRTSSQRESDAEEMKSRFFTLITVSFSFTKDDGVSDFVHWVSHAHLIICNCWNSLRC